jgi:hypothetical protein
VRLGESDHLVPIDERHLPFRDPGRVDAFTRVGQDLLLLNSDREHAAKGPIVPMSRRWSDAGSDLVVQPVLDLVGGQLAKAVYAESRQRVLVEVTAIGLLRCRREPPALRQELLCPNRERCVGVARIDPLAAQLIGINLSQEPLGVSLARLDFADKVRESSSVLAALLLDVSHSVPPMPCEG